MRFVHDTRTLLLMFFILFAATAIAHAWRPITPGIEYQDIGHNLINPWSHIHVFRIDLKKIKLDIITAHELDRHQASVDQFAHRSQALIAINGGFFDKNYQPLGLRIGNTHQYSPVKDISWWGIFYIFNHTPHITNFSHYSQHNHPDFAIQSGPRLVIHGQIPSLKPGHAERTALGITKNNHLIILVTDHAPMTTYELAKLMQSSPLSCQDALNLDGGSSSQLYVQTDNFQLNVQGFSGVSDAIIVKRQT